MTGSIHILGVPADFVLFGITLLGVALFHRHTLAVALGGAIAIAGYKLAFTGFREGTGLQGLMVHIGHEWVMLANLLCLLMGFAILSRHFEKSHLPVILPRYLPHGWKGGFALLALVFLISGFLDNIAAAMIGGAMAHQLFRARVHIGYLAALVAAANAGGAGSVVGDTTTTMMWISGITPSHVVHAYVPALAALVIVGVVGARQQHAHSPMISRAHQYVAIDWARVAMVGLMLFAAIATNVTVSMNFPTWVDRFPFIGAALWFAIAITCRVRRHDWEVLPEAFRGSLFLLSLVLCASMMPVEALPQPSWLTALGLGFVSSVFDNIPLTALAIKQGGYDWGVLAYAVGFGGSMVWFGSSAGVALSNMYPEARSVGNWLIHGWHVALAYVVGFVIMLGLLGWNPQTTGNAPPPTPAVAGGGEAWASARTAPASLAAKP